MTATYPNHFGGFPTCVFCGRRTKCLATTADRRVVATGEALTCGPCYRERADAADRIGGAA